MAYQRPRRRPVRLALSADTSHGPAWYQAIGSLTSQPPGRRVSRRMPGLGSLGADEPSGSTLSNPTITDPTLLWQNDVLSQLRDGVQTLQKAELQKWLQIVATVTIPVAAALWNLILKKSPGQSGV